MNSKAYREQGIDLKRFTLVMAKKLWVLVAALLLGAVLGGVLYEVITQLTNGETKYRASADYYITFNFDEFEHGDDYFNAFTWDGVLKDDPIVESALTKLPKNITKDRIKQAVRAEMLGDYRILTVHVTDRDKDTVERIADAYREALTDFGQSLALFEKIEMWSQEEAVVLEENTKTKNAAFLGALVLGTMAFLGLCYYYLLEDAFYTEKDLRERLQIPVFGIKTRKKDSLEEERLENNLKLLEKKDYVSWQAEEIPDKDDWENLKGKEILLLIPWGQNVGRRTECLLEDMRLHSCNVAGGVLVKAEDSFIKAYYGRKERE